MLSNDIFINNNNNNNFLSKSCSFLLNKINFFNIGKVTEIVIRCLYNYQFNFHSVSIWCVCAC